MEIVKYSGPAYPVLPMDLLERCIDGRARVVWQNTPLSLRLSRDERRLFDAAVERDYLIAPAGCRNTINAYYCWAEIQNKPVVVVKQKKRYATIKCDLITLRNSQGIIHRLGERECGVAASILATYSGLGATIRTGGIYFSSDRVRIESAEECAVRIYQYVMHSLEQDEVRQKIREMINPNSYPSGKLTPEHVRNAIWN